MARSAHPSVGMRPSVGGALDPPLRRMVERRLLDRYAPPHVVVNRRGDAVHVSAGAGRFLERAAGAPGRNLLAMARPGLRPGLDAALQEAMQTHRPARCAALAEAQDGPALPVTITVEPIGQAADPLFLATFTEEGGPPGREAAVADRPGDGKTLARLEEELVEIRERLRASKADCETALNGLKLANEDMVSMNAALRTATEAQKAASTERCMTNEALVRAHAELHTLVENTHAATILLDRRQVIRSFTPSAAEVFDLRPGDVGRPLTEITCALDYLDLRADIEEVLHTGALRERPAARRDGRGHHLARLVGCRATDGRIDGLLATFADITSIVRAEAQQRMLVAELNHRVKNSLAVVVGIAAGSLPGGPAREAFIARLKALSRAHDLLSREHWTSVRLADILWGEAATCAVDGQDRLALSGPGLQVPPRTAQSLALMVHELATNATQYGSLSVASGRVEIAWSRTDTDGRARLHLVWRETGGPKVRRRRRHGFGCRVIEREVRAGGGTVELDFAPEGLRASIELPLDEPPMPVLSMAEVPGIDPAAAQAPPPDHRGHGPVPGAWPPPPHA